jgi:hypothetical protein
VAVVVTVVAE